MPAKQNKTPLTEVSQNVNQKVVNEGEYDTPYIRMLTDEKNRHRNRADSLQKKLEQCRVEFQEKLNEQQIKIENFQNSSHELENKLRDENRVLMSQNESLNIKLQNCGISNFWFIAGTVIFAVIGAMNTSLIEWIGKLGYYCSFCVACCFVLFHIVSSGIRDFLKR